MTFKHNVCGEVDLSGSITRQNEDTYEMKSYLDQHFHTEKIGKMVEDLEGTLRSQIEEVYFKKSQEVKFILYDRLLILADLVRC